MSVDLAKDIAYVPKVNFGYRSSASAHVGYLAITSEALYFVPEKFDDVQVESQELTRVLELDGSLEKEFWRIIPLLAQEMPLDKLAWVIEKMAAAIEGSIVIPLSSVRAFKFGLMGFEAVCEERVLNFTVGHAPKKTKRLKGYLRQRGLLTV